MINVILNYIVHVYLAVSLPVLTKLSNWQRLYSYPYAANKSALLTICNSVRNCHAMISRCSRVKDNGGS